MASDIASARVLSTSWCALVSARPKSSKRMSRFRQNSVRIDFSTAVSSCMRVSFLEVLDTPRVEGNPHLTSRPCRGLRPPKPYALSHYETSG